MKITTRIKKSIQTNVLFEKDNIDSTEYKVKKTSFIKHIAHKNIQSLNTDDVYRIQEMNDEENRENNKYRTEKVVFKSRIYRREIVANFILRHFSFLKSRKNHLRAMYATKNGYRTCDYSKRKGFYNF